jgi:hypothetical protein
MQGKFDKENLIMRLSRERLSSYGDLSDQTFSEILAKYIWNLNLCESLYQSLHWLEISLRNNIHVAFSSAWGDDWHINGSLFTKEQEMINKTIKNINLPREKISPADITAATNFGLWTSLFRGEYEQKLRPLLKNIFPHVQPYSERTRSNLSNKLHGIRNFRNRVFHFEPIFNYKPEKKYADIQQMINWVAPELLPILEISCEFQVEYDCGFKKYLEKADKLLTEKFRSN